MWRWWASVLLGFDDPKIRDAQIRFSRAALKTVGQTGFNTTITDVEHAPEDTTDNLVRPVRADLPVVNKSTNRYPR